MKSNKDLADVSQKREDIFYYYLEENYRQSCSYLHIAPFPSSFIQNSRGNVDLEKSTEKEVVFIKSKIWGYLKKGSDDKAWFPILTLMHNCVDMVLKEFSQQ